MSAKLPPRRPATYPEICLSGPVGILQDHLRKSGSPLKDIHDMAHRMERLSLLNGVGTNRTDLFVQWSIHQWLNSNKPLFVLERDLAWALANTEPPMEKFDLLPELPIDGMYVSLPPVFDLDGGSTGNHKIEGLFLTKNDILVPKDGTYLESSTTKIKNSDISKFDVVPSITILGVGEDKNKYSNQGWLRDDAIVFFSLVPGKPLYLPEKHLGVTELTRVVANLLYILQNTNELYTQKDPPLPVSLTGSDRTANRKRERELEKGRSCLPHTVWKLSSLEDKRENKEETSGEEPSRKLRGHIVLGHIHKYWVLDPLKRKSLGTKTSPTKTRGERTYHLVAKWIPPYTRGEGPVEHSPTVFVR